MSDNTRRIRLKRQIASSRGTAGPGDIVDLPADEAEDLIVGGAAVAVEDPAHGDAGSERNPPSAGAFSDEEWRRGIELDDWAKWRSPATYEKHKESSTSATVRRLHDVLRADVREGRVELGVPPDSILGAVRPISADALDEVIDAIDFSYPMAPFKVYYAEEWSEIRVYRAGRPTGVPAESEATPPPPAASVERRGAKPKFDWDEFWVEVIRIIRDEGLPVTQAELERRMLEWCADEWDEEPGLSSVRKRLTKVYRRLGPD